MVGPPVSMSRALAQRVPPRRGGYGEAGGEVPWLQAMAFPNATALIPRPLAEEVTTTLMRPTPAAFAAACLQPPLTSHPNPVARHLLQNTANLETPGVVLVAPE